MLTKILIGGLCLVHLTLADYFQFEYHAYAKGAGGVTRVLTNFIDVNSEVVDKKECTRFGPQMYWDPDRKYLSICRLF